MKKLNLMSILIGAVLGIAATIIINNYFFPEKNYSPFPEEKKLNEINVSDANKSIEGYKLTAKDTCVYKWAINVSKEQYDVIRQTVGSMNSQQLATISGFRLYFADMPTTNSVVSFAYIIDNSFRQQIPPNGRILVSLPYNLLYSQECPPFCN